MNCSRLNREIAVSSARRRQRLAQCAGAEAVAGAEVETHTEPVSALRRALRTTIFPCKRGQFIAHGNVHDGTVCRAT